MTKTVGQIIKKEVAKIIDMAGWERKPDHPFYGKSEKEIAELLLLDEQMAIFKAEEIIKAVRRHYEGKNIKARLVAKSPYTTWCVELTYPEKEIPKELFKDLENYGWKSYGGNVPPIHGEKEISFSKDGAGIFCGWTPEERQANLKEVRRILKQYGLVNVPKVRLTLEDLL